MKLICLDAYLLTGIEQAVRDGVDVLSMSLGSGPDQFHRSGIAVASFSAVLKNIVPVACAMNEGPTPSVISNDAPWLLTVGASTTDRRIRATVKVGNMELDGESAYQPSSFNSSEMELVFPGARLVESDLKCQTLNNFNVTGKMVLCMADGISNTVTGERVKAAGGEAMVIINNKKHGFTTIADPHVLPASHISNADAKKIISYIKNNPDPKATIIFKGTQFAASPAPAIAFFSGRGPSLFNGGIIKPDIVAPGVNILAAWPTEFGPNPTGNKTSTFNFDSGTSMATPHIAGIVADLKKNHPDWSPAAIKSAIMTTAYVKDLDGHPIGDEAFMYKPASYFAMGAGHVDPDKANDPGLVYDIQPFDYIPYLCSMYPTHIVKAIVQQRWVDCGTIQRITPAELNYPSIGVTMPIKKGSAFVINRTLTNVGPAEVYDLRIKLPDGVDIRADTQNLSFSSMYEKQSFRLEFTSNGTAQPEQVSEGYLTWSSTNHVVRSPISVTYN
ncbi:hypothetical protein J5N97_023356 [Dioscorea zingiberensis]|uniref:Uncharacterized protein n=1 Tax=Dioscorea zingiberensis TaxID=325984 RepID=A0A9D5CCP2_9LILI|nr:hypothetical protein J5N97_023356 [Dioscorea zingiberensis]